MAMLAVQEAIRRRVLIAFVVFVVIILFAGWYLDVQSDNPARLYSELCANRVKLFGGAVSAVSQHI